MSVPAALSRCGRGGAPMTGTRGQASVELVAAVPLCLVAALAAAEVLAAGAAREAAGAAAQAGAMAFVQGGDPVRAARAGAPGWSRSRLVIRVSGRRVRVRVRPPALVPGTAGLLEGSAEADAGPAA